MTEDHGLTVGRYLRQEREKKGVPLESVASVTRITRENLEALERDDFQTISAPVFVRGFLRSYANYLGLDPQELVGRYDSQTDLLKTPPAKEAPQPSKDGTPSLKYLLFFSILVAAAALGFYYSQKSSAPPSPLPPTAAVAPSPTPAAPSPAPLLKTPPSKAVTPLEEAVPKAVLPEKEKKPSEKLPATTAVQPDKEAAKERRHVLKAVATEKTWMRIRTDDQQTFDVLLQPKETATWTARRWFEIAVGNAGGVELSLNGVPQGPLGKSGEVRHLILPQETKVTPPPKPAPARESPPAKVSEPVEPGSPSPGPPKDAPSQGPKTSTALPWKENMPPQEPAAKENNPSVDREAKESKPAEAETESEKNPR